MNIKNNTYSPECHKAIFEYLCKIYPSRPKQYLDWWLTVIDGAGEECWNKVVYITDDDRIIGCSLASVFRIYVENKVETYFTSGNTILNPEYRGKGLSKYFYEQVNEFDNWIRVGFTDVAFKVMPRFVKSFTPINPVNVYISVNRAIVGQLFRKLLHKKTNWKGFPTDISIGGNNRLKKIDNPEMLTIPPDGHWTNDEAEFVRDKDFIKNRFFEIYCSDRYGIYECLFADKSIGYIVLRKAVYSSYEMLSLVDYRFYSRKDETKAFNAVSRLARYNNIGLVITLTSRNYKPQLFPLTIKMKKKLGCATGMKSKLAIFNKMLITSADSDLDFVYYH